jgi:flagellar hook-associated protein 1 FlgK
MALSGLDSALSGLRVAQQQLNVISTNISNVSTEGYTRKLLPQATVAIDGIDSGVAGNAIIRKVDLSLERDYWTQVSKTNFYDAQIEALTQIQQFHGGPDQNRSVAAKLAELRDSFISASNAPDNTQTLKNVVDKADIAAKKINDLANLFTTLRNDAQDQMQVSVTKINTLVQQIADINVQVRNAHVMGKTTASFEDSRDRAIKELSKEISVSFFVRGDGVMVVQTDEGQELASDKANVLSFRPTPLGATSSYPTSAAGIYLGGDPTQEPVTFDLTKRSIGGRLGGLLELRDVIMPEHTAQIDELAHKLALRFDAQGVQLFTDATGLVPLDTNPIPNPPGPLTPVPYVGFASEIRVNKDILADNSLIRSSTLTGANVQEGSPEFLRRVVEFTFGKTEYMEAQGGVDVRVAGLPDTLQNVFGLDPMARMVSSVNLISLANGNPLNAATDNPFTPPAGPPLIDDFTVRFDQGGVNDTGDIVIDLGTIDGLYPTPPANGAQPLVNYLNNDIIPTLAPPLNTSITASLNPFGQLVIESQVDITIGAGSMGNDGLSFLGLQAGTTVAQDPSFSVQIGKDTPVAVTVSPGDTEVDLLNKLNVIPGVVATIDAGTGFLSIRPGVGFGGDIKLIAGPILSASNTSILQELFGSSDPVVSVAHASFRQQNLGPNADQDSEIAGAEDLLSYSQKLVTRQTEIAQEVDARKGDEQSFHDILQRRLQDDSGVNTEEELSHLILVQTAFAAAAKAVSAIDDMFKVLIQAI